LNNTTGRKANRQTSINRKYIDKNNRKRNTFFKKISGHIVLIFFICALLGTSAYLIIKNSINNSFIIGDVKTEIIQDLDINDKKTESVSIKNTGNIDVFVRVAVNIVWKDSEGVILNVNPKENVDYVINFSSSTKWLKSNDGYFYYKNMLQENTNTEILIDKIEQINYLNGKTLDINIAVQAIQAEPAKAVIEAWNVNVENSEIALKE